MVHSFMKQRRHHHKYASATLLPSSAHGGHSRPRVDKLQTLEAKMASIEVSLGWRRRREALLETLPRAARELVREMDTLQQAVKDKDNLIQALRTQITNLGGSVATTECGAITDSERRSIQDRVAKVQQEIDAKTVAIKNLRLTLDKIDITDNIDVRIRAAELEYELEREELNVLNLKEELSVLNSRLQEQQGTPPALPVVTLHQLVAGGSGGGGGGGGSGGGGGCVAMLLVVVTVSHTPGNPPFHVTSRPPLGCAIDWATEDTKLKRGDRLVEVNGESVLGRSVEEVTRLVSRASHVDLVVARSSTGTGGGGSCGGGGGGSGSGLGGTSRRSESRLERQVEERTKELKELTTKLDKAIKEKDSFKSTNTRLTHRISYLEEQVSEMQRTAPRSPDVGPTPSQPGATVIQVFQKGSQTLAVAGPDVDASKDTARQYPTLPRLKSPDRSANTTPTPPTSSSGCPRPPSSATAAANGGDKPKRLLSPRPDSRGEESRPPSRSKPIPPKKPERLSLQRTTSLQSVEEGRPASQSSSSSNHRQHTLQTWPSLDTDLDGRLQTNHHSSMSSSSKSRRASTHIGYGIANDYNAVVVSHRHSHTQKAEAEAEAEVVEAETVKEERWGRRPSPQGSASSPPRERRNSSRYPHARSPDSSVYLDGPSPSSPASHVTCTASFSTSSSSTTTHVQYHSRRPYASPYESEYEMYGRLTRSPYVVHPRQYHQQHHQQKHHQQQHHQRQQHNSQQQPYVTTPPPAPRHPPLSVHASPKPSEQWC